MIWQRILGTLLLGMTLLNLSAIRCVDAAEQFLEFNISPAPLDQALAAFSSVTKEQLMISASIADGRRSAAVKGKFTAEAALRQMLAGSGLTVRRIGQQGYTLVPLSSSDEAEEKDTAMSRTLWRFNAYSAAVQSAVDRVLCERVETVPGDYRAMTRLWIGTAGAVERAELLTSSGDAGRDALLAVRLQGLMVGVPPSGLPQPVTLLITGEGAGPNYCAAVHADRAGREAAR